MERLDNTTNMSREPTPSRENDEIDKKARKAEQKAKKDAAKASQRALAELTNKARCVEFERATRSQTLPENLPLPELLSAAYCRRRKDGWRARDFGFDLTSRNCSRTDRFKSLVLQDYQALKVYLSNCDRSDPDAASRHSMK